MLIKVQDDQGNDKHLVECKRIHWLGVAHLQCYAEAQQPLPSVTLNLKHGDRVYVMNAEGQTIDSKRVVLDTCEVCDSSGLTPSGQPCLACM